MVIDYDALHEDFIKKIKFHLYPGWMRVDASNLFLSSIRLVLPRDGEKSFQSPW